MAVTVAVVDSVAAAVALLVAAAAAALVVAVVDSVAAVTVAGADLEADAASEGKLLINGQSYDDLF